MWELREDLQNFMISKGTDETIYLREDKVNKLLFEKEQEVLKRIKKEQLPEIIISEFQEEINREIFKRLMMGIGVKDTPNSEQDIGYFECLKEMKFMIDFCKDRYLQKYKELIE